MIIIHVAVGTNEGILMSGMLLETVQYQSETCALCKMLRLE